ncbi:Putative glycerol kinase [Listeria ivanovii subsp. ivanovii PAM 55]|uniref:ATP:glycerol 3-phosphotransferase n=1 Tax=Listeria ivanovii (strain ATCC BAA-678 / PAM 55) TaxID=881621 RepID=G2ZE92_LISIP|nr:glycerol kinase [Listeria ivanovii WSLC3009]AIS64989.1 glycerol kinase [Listeria ivanovii subsp. ivanovii]CBW85464.1 Putative glycerol kinase [Listeria ivanovii subsp. ivanovii PAM 55]SNV40158.1 Glycerol kinase [Listeria ivanovii subsp. ivanovii]SNV89062.1 Glycerol kinase [Listeria ivanovii subsp. ivanovii]
MKKHYQIAIDQSTSGTKVLLFKAGELVDRLDKKHQQLYPHKGWVEHNPIEICQNVRTLIANILAKHNLVAAEIERLALTNQRETIVAWDKQTGKPLYNAIVWQCNRTKKICETLKKDGCEKRIKQITGLKIDSYFSAPKMKWLLENISAVRDAVSRNQLAFGTMDAWVLFSLTDDSNYFTDRTNASRTLLYDIRKNDWSDELLELFGVARAHLPEVKQSVGDFGSYLGIPIHSVMADSEAALYGQGCNTFGGVKATLGTGCSVMMQIGENRLPENDAILTTLAWDNAGVNQFALEGIIRSCGDTLVFLSEHLELFKDYHTACKQAFQLPSNDGVVLIPGQLGLGAPYWNTNIQAEIIGLTREHTKWHIIRAGYTSIAFQIKAVIDQMELMTGQNIKRLQVDGGLTKQPELMQYLANVLNAEVAVSPVEELSAMGVIKIAEIKSQEERKLAKLYQPDITYTNALDDFQNWEKQVKSSILKYRR